MSRSNQSFFTADNRATPTKVDTAALQLIDVGGNGDCGFKAVAAGLIDFVRSNSRVSDMTLKKMLTCYFRYYPQFKAEQAYLTAKDRVEILLRNMPLPEFVTTMAYALRQMAVDTMVADVEKYRYAFIHDRGFTSPSLLRQENTWTGVTALAALAYEMDMRVAVFVAGPQREGHLLKDYNKSESVGKPEIIIKLDGQHYMSKVRQPEFFKSLTQRKSRVIQPVVVDLVDPDMQSIIKKIEKYDQNLLERYQLIKKQIKSAVDAGEISKKELIDLHISGMHSSSVNGQVMPIGLEHGNQAFFQALEARQYAPLEKTRYADHNERIAEELIQALARAVSIGQMPEDELFISVEEHRNAFK